MITIQYMKPFLTKVSGKKLRLIFAHQYLLIMKEEEEYTFVPIEGKEIVVDLETGQVKNLNEIFVFQKGNKLIRMPLYKLFLKTNLQELIDPYIKEHTFSKKEKRKNRMNKEVEEIVIRSLIDRALDIGDEAAFMELTEQLKKIVI